MKKNSAIKIFTILFLISSIICSCTSINKNSLDTIILKELELKTGLLGQIIELETKEITENIDNENIDNNSNRFFMAFLYCGQSQTNYKKNYIEIFIIDIDDEILYNKEFRFDSTSTWGDHSWHEGRLLVALTKSEIRSIKKVTILIKPGDYQVGFGGFRYAFLNENDYPDLTESIGKLYDK